MSKWSQLMLWPVVLTIADPRALVFQPLVKGNEALGTRLAWWRSFLVTGNGKRYRSIRLTKIRKFKPEFLVEWNAPKDLRFPVPLDKGNRNEIGRGFDRKFVINTAILGTKISFDGFVLNCYNSPSSSHVIRHWKSSEKIQIGLLG